jgi:transaldolase
MTLATIDAFRQHGRLRSQIGDDVTAARNTMAALERAGIALDEVTDALLEDGLAQFSDALRGLLAAIERGQHE